MADWRPVIGFEGFYEVSDDGRVRSIDRVIRVRNSRGALAERHYRGVDLTPCPSSSGHLVVTLNRVGIRSTPKVHRLVLEAFVGPCPLGQECCHWDDDPTNNRLSNLRWDTRSANGFDKVRNGKCKQANQTHCVNGHEFTPANTYVRRGRRNCRACNRRAAQTYSRARRSA